MKHLVHVFKAAKAHLADGVHPAYGKVTYICFALRQAAFEAFPEDDTKAKVATQEAEAFVEGRLTQRHTAETWLVEKLGCEVTNQQAQEFRHAWLDAMIHELETGERLPGFPEEDLKVEHDLRAETAAVLRAAKNYLRKGVRSVFDGDSYHICFAIAETRLHNSTLIEGCNNAVRLISERLQSGNSGGFPTVYRWMSVKGSGREKERKHLQEFRHAWVDALIHEMETGERLPGFPEEDLKEVPNG